METERWRERLGAARAEVATILDENDKIEARCEFCCRTYTLGPEAIRAHFAALEAGGG